MNLTELYANPQEVSFLHSRYYVEGCLVGACACPEIPLPDVWLPWVIKQHNQIQNAAQADQITNELFNYFKHCLAQMNNSTLVIPEYVKYSGEFEKDRPLREWCKGLLMAHSAREQFWQGAWRKMQQQDPKLAPQMAKDLKHCLLMFSTFADPKETLRDAEVKSLDQAQALRENMPLIAQSLNDTLTTYVNLAGKLATYLPNQFETFKQD